jgi:flavin-binding protein dodecin
MLIISLHTLKSISFSSTSKTALAAAAAAAITKAGVFSSLEAK